MVVGGGLVDGTTLVVLEVSPSSCSSVGGAVVGGAVVGVGAAVVGATVVGASVVVGATVLGGAGVVVGTIVVGGAVVATVTGAGAMGWSSEPKRSRAASAASTSTATTASTGVGRPRRRRTETTGSSKTVRGPTATTDGAGGRRSAPTSPPPRSARVTMGFGPVGASPPRHQKAPPRAPMRSPTTPDGPWAARAATARVSSRMAGSGTRARRAASTSTGSTAVAPSGRTNTNSSGTASRMWRHRA